MSPGEERLVRNQRRFRRANDRLQACVGAIAGDDLPIPFLCECADDSCVEPVRATSIQYLAVRDEGERFLVLKGHPTAAGDGVAA
jgi:hypothetical protein